MVKHVSKHLPSAGTLSEEEMKERAKSWNYDELEKIGYWINPDDCWNIEVTMVFKFINSNTNSTYNENNNKEHDISIVTRSLFHDSESAYSDKNNNNNIHIKIYHIHIIVEDQVTTIIFQMKVM